LIPASGFYEWSEPRGGRKRPYFIRPHHEPLFAIAGLWERWRAATGDKLETCVIVTTDATPKLVKIHDRMPLLIPRDAQALWLDPKTSLDDVLKVAERPPALETHAVGFGVNDPKNDDEALIAPVEDAAAPASGAYS
jgi:putative SOS response-associated peptidase YedK